MAIPTVAIAESGMSLHAGQVKKLLRGQIIIAKVTLERAPDIVGRNAKMNVIVVVEYTVAVLGKKR